MTIDPILQDHCQRIETIHDVPVASIKNSIFYIYFTCDSDALPHLKVIIEHGGLIFPPLSFDKTQYRFINRAAFDTLKNTWAHAKSLSHLELNVHENICEAIEMTRKVEGDYVEIGVYLGGSAFTALHYLTAIGKKRSAWLLDTYDGFNYKEARSSSDAIWKDTHQLFGVKKTMQRISEILSSSGQEARLIESNICEQSLPAEITAIAVANIDVDLYEATKSALAKVAPLMSLGGIMICEDPASTPGLYGAAVAMHEFLDSIEGMKFLPIFKGGQYFLVKTSS